MNQLECIIKKIKRNRTFKQVKVNEDTVKKLIGKGLRRFKNQSGKEGLLFITLNQTTPFNRFSNGFYIKP